MEVVGQSLGTNGCERVCFSFPPVPLMIVNMVVIVYELILG